MKRLIIILITITLCAASAQAQTWNEWFRQKKTQKRYLIKQVGLLQLYLGYLKKGYEVVHNGLNTIEHIKDGDFNLHRDFFSHLKNVNPHLANSARVADVIAYQVFIIREIRRVNNYCQSNEDFTIQEVRYVSDVYSNMLLLTDANISELMTIITSNKTEMKDDERLERIDSLYDESMDQYAFTRSFSNETFGLGFSRAKERKDISTIKSLQL